MNNEKAESEGHGLGASERCCDGKVSSRVAVHTGTETKGPYSFQVISKISTRCKKDNLKHAVRIARSQDAMLGRQRVAARAGLAISERNLRNLAAGAPTM